MPRCIGHGGAYRQADSYYWAMRDVDVSSRPALRSRLVMFLHASSLLMHIDAGMTRRRDIAVSGHDAFRLDTAAVPAEGYAGASASMTDFLDDASYSRNTRHSARQPGHLPPEEQLDEFLLRTIAYFITVIACPLDAAFPRFIVRYWSEQQVGKRFAAARHRATPGTRHAEVTLTSPKKITLAAER